MKKVTYYIVIDNDVDMNNTHVYTVCQSKDNCKEFIDRYLLAKNVEHYESWCKLRKIESHNHDNWIQYKEMLGINNNLRIVKVKNTLNNILAMIRKSYDCISVNCSYETDFEKVK